MGERKEGLAEFLWNELRSAVADTRTKLIDEGWFGRRTPAPNQNMAKDLGWTLERSDSAFAGPTASTFEEKFATRSTDERSGPEPDRGHDFDR